MGVSMNALVVVLKLLVGLSIFLIESICWLVVGIGQAFRLTGEVIDARRRLAGGLHCARGHLVSDTGTFVCAACSFRWTGSGWICANPSCHATTPFLNCEMCGLSVRNPHVFEGGHGREGK